MEQVSFKDKKPTLYLVATPIGNLDDITFRAIDTLKNVSVVFAEDTRTSGVLFKHYDIKTKMISYHEHEKYDKISECLKYLEEGLDIALISDAGTPGISDPGFELIKEVINNNYYVVSIPGAVASINALIPSGLMIQPHLFLGFLPRKESEIKSFLNNYKDVDATLIFYESPFRVRKTINYLCEVLGNRELVLAREITKLYETYTRTTLKEANTLELKEKGEYVVLVGKRLDIDEKTPSIEELYRKYIKENDNEKEVLSLIAKELKISKKEVYKKIKVDNK